MGYKCALTKNRGGSEEKKRCDHVADTTEEQLRAFPRKNQSVTVLVYCRAHCSLYQPQEGRVESASSKITEIDTTHIQGQMHVDMEHHTQISLLNISFDFHLTSQNFSIDVGICCGDLLPFWVVSNSEMN